MPVLVLLLLPVNRAWVRLPVAAAAVLVDVIDLAMWVSTACRVDARTVLRALPLHRVVPQIVFESVAVSLSEPKLPVSLVPLVNLGYVWLLRVGWCRETSHAPNKTSVAASTIMWDNILDQLASPFLTDNLPQITHQFILKYLYKLVGDLGDV